MPSIIRELYTKIILPAGFFSVLFLSIGKIKMQQVWKGQTESPLILCMISEIIKKLC